MDDALKVQYDLLMQIQEAMNLALEEDLEKRGLKFARPTQELFSQAGGASCA
jgi:hypothetical protein